MSYPFFSGKGGLGGSRQRPLPIISKLGQRLKPEFDDGASSTVQIQSLCEQLRVGGSHYKGKSMA